MKKKINFPWGEVVTPKVDKKDRRTPLIYYGGKSRDADWILSYCPPHKTWVDVFGGGGAVSFRKPPSEVEVYNDIGNVSNFFKVLRNNGEELFKLLYLTPFSRQELLECTKWEDYMKPGMELEWARMWFTVINQGYTHEERSNTWHIAKQVNSVRAHFNRVLEIPDLVERMQNMHIEHYSFEKIIELYDMEDTLFYMDPPYLKETRASQENYLNEMTYDQHCTMLDLAVKMKAQCIISGYASQLYDENLKSFRRVEKTAKSAIQNSHSLAGRADRTEVLWIKEHKAGLWHEAQSGASTTLARVLHQETNVS